MALTENETLRLLKEMAEGNQAASHQFYRAYSPIVRKFLLRRGEEPALVEDALQVTMLEVWKRPERFQLGGGASFKTWLLRIASNRLIDLQRKRPDRVEELDEEMISSEINEGYERVHAAQRSA